MATKITFTDDVGRVSTAQNVAGTIRWHVYDRTVGGVPGIYVQRELADVLQPEQQILVQGDRPEVFFDVGLAQFILLYRKDERMFMLRYLEAEVPVLESAQLAVVVQPPIPAGVTFTPVDLHSPGPADSAQPDSVAQRQFGLTESAPSVDAYNGPPPPLAIGVGAAPTAGFFRIRWRARLSTNADGNATWFYDPVRHYIAGFHVYLRRQDSGALERLTLSMVPFVGLDPVVYELEVPAVAGTYFVTQVNRQGPYSTNLVEGRIHSPRDVVRSDGTLLPDVVRSFMDSKVGESIQSQDLRFVVVSTGAVVITPPSETFPSHLGEGFGSSSRIISSYSPQFVADQADTFPSHLGAGFYARITLGGETYVVGI